MAAPTFSEQLTAAQEALHAVVSGKLLSHSSLSGSFTKLSPGELRDHINWLEQKVREEAMATGRNSSRVGYIGNNAGSAYE